MVKPSRAQLEKKKDNLKIHLYSYLLDQSSAPFLGVKLSQGSIWPVHIFKYFYAKVQELFYEMTSVLTLFLHTKMCMYILCFPAVFFIVNWELFETERYVINYSIFKCNI